MIKENFFTGEPVQSGSPGFISEQEAIQNAGFGSYDYDPGIRASMAQQPVSIFPGGYGYTSSPIQPNPAFNMYMNPPNDGSGMFYNPWLLYQQQYQQQMMFQQQMQQMMQQEVKTYIQPVSFSGEYLPSIDWEEKTQQLMMNYWLKEQDAMGEQAAKSNGTYNPFGTNYYGLPYFGSYNYNYALNMEMSQKIEELKNEAKENRINLSMRLSKLVHNYMKDNCTDQEINDMYHGKIVDNPNQSSGITYGDLMMQQRFSQLEPFDNSQVYQEYSSNVSNEFHKIIPKDLNLKDTFAKMGELGAQYELEEEVHRRRNVGVLYNSENNAYKIYVREKAAERYHQSKNTTHLKDIVNGVDQLKQGNLQNFPTLAQSARLCDDGSLTITCPFGSKTGEPYTVSSNNSQESAYDANRERFYQFIDSISNSVYLDSPNAGD